MAGMGQPPGSSGGWGNPPGGGGFGQPPASGGGFGQPPASGGGFGQPPAGFGAGPREELPGFKLWLVVSIIALIFGAILTGAPGLALVVMAKSDWDQGKRDEALSKLKIAKILGIISIVIGVLVFLAFLAAFIIPIVLAVTNAASPPHY